MNNIIKIFESIVAENPTKLALIDKKGRVTFEELHTLVDQCCTRYTLKGITKGTKVLVLIPVSIDLYINVLALFKLGAVVVFTDEWVNKKRLSVCIDLVGIDALVSNHKGYLYSHVHPGLRQIKTKIKYKKSKNILPQGEDSRSEDSALVTFTTGSTGIPKAANRTHGFLLAQYQELYHLLSPMKKEVCMTTLPIVTLCCIGLGMTTVLPDYNHKMPAKSNLDRIVSQIQDNRIRSIIGSPFFIHQLSSRADDIQEIKNILVGGAAVFHKDAARWSNCFPDTSIVIIYGSTEAEPIAQINATQLLDEASVSENAGVCVGKINDRLDCKIIEICSETISTYDPKILVNEKVVGEVIVAGDHVLQSYINSPEAIKQNKIPQGNKLWHRTGDAGYVKDGYLYLVGRASQMITIKGRRLGIFTIEEQLNDIDGIEKGTIIKKDCKTQIILNGKPSSQALDKVKELFGNLEIRTDIKIPMDPRHHSKIDYAKLKEIA